MKRQHAPIQGFDTNLTIDEVIEQLNAKDEPEVLNGLRNLTALLSHGVAVEGALPHVIKLVVLPDLQIRRVVYTFLAHFSESCPAQALMAVNILERALSDKNSLVRGLAMRALTSIRVREISEVAKIAMEQHRADEAPFVRRIIAIGIGKMASFCPEFADDFADLLGLFLDDSVAQVVGAAIEAYNLVCPTRYDLIHQHFHKICGMMNEFDEFQQVEALQLLAHYCRTSFADCSRLTDEEISPDLAQACKVAALLLRVHYPSVVLEASSFIYHCSPAFSREYEIQGVCESASHAVAVSLVRQASNYLNMNPLAIFTAIRQISATHPQLFVAFYKDFYINTFDTGAAKFEKICILKNLIRSTPDTEEDNILSEMKMYLEYSLSSIYEEQEEMTQFVLQVIGSIVRRKATEMIGKLDEFDEEYLSILRGPIRRATNEGADYLFANDIILQQSVVEFTGVLSVLYAENRAENMFVENTIGDVLITSEQIYTDIEQDASEDARQVIPRGVWPSSLGFPQEMDPIEFKNDVYNGKVNVKSIVQVTKVDIFIQQCLRDLIQVYPVMQRATQTPRCVSSRVFLIYSFIELRYVFAPFYVEFLRRALRSMTDEPSPVRRSLCALALICVREVELFRAAPVYFEQRRILSDLNAQEQGKPLSFNGYQQITVEDGRSVLEIVVMTPELVAEEEANIGYCIEQMAEYSKEVCQLDISFDTRDFAIVMEFGKIEQTTSTGKPPVMPEVMGSLSNTIGGLGETTRELPLWAAESTSDEIRKERVDKPTRITVGSPDISSPTEGAMKEDTGIQIRSDVGLDNFLGEQQPKAVTQEDESSDYYYYSDNQNDESSEPETEKAWVKPVTMRPVVRVAPVQVVPVVKPSPPASVQKPSESSSAPVVEQIEKAVLPVAEKVTEPPKQEAQNDDDDLLNMLFE